MLPSKYYFNGLCYILLFSCAGTIQNDTMHNSTLYEGNYCDLLCHGSPYTLCATNKDKLKCSPEYNVVYDINSFHTIDVKKLLVMGHNGLRDRIAQRMRVSAMIELAWDRELENMATAYLYECKPFEDDPCTHYDVVVPFSKIYTYFMRNNDAYKFVAQNRFCVAGNYFPVNFIEMAMRSWYFDKVHLLRPRFEIVGSVMRLVGILQGENNFTHLAYPLTTHIGCGIAKFRGLFCIFCNYHPYYHCPNNTLQYEVGNPTSLCPAYFPLENEYFTSLCGLNMFSSSGGCRFLNLWKRITLCFGVVIVYILQTLLPHIRNSNI